MKLLRSGRRTFCLYFEVQDIWFGVTARHQMWGFPIETGWVPVPSSHLIKTTFNPPYLRGVFVKSIERYFGICATFAPNYLKIRAKSVKQWTIIKRYNWLWINKICCFLWSYDWLGFAVEDRRISPSAQCSSLESS